MTTKEFLQIWTQLEEMSIEIKTKFAHNNIFRRVMVTEVSLQTIIREFDSY